MSSVDWLPKYRDRLWAQNTNGQVLDCLTLPLPVLLIDQRKQSASDMRTSYHLNPYILAPFCMKMKAFSFWFLYPLPMDPAADSAPRPPKIYHL